LLLASLGSSIGYTGLARKKNISGLASYPSTAPGRPINGQNCLLDSFADAAGREEPPYAKNESVTL